MPIEATGAGYEDRLLTEAEVKETVSGGLARADLDGKRVLAIIPDHSRTAPIGQLFRHLYEAAGDRVEKLDCLLALGTHPPMSDEMIYRRVGITAEEHREKFPKHNEMPYFNSGSCLYPSHITALEIVNSTIALVRWRVDPNEDGFLQVTRRVIAGPEPLHNFDLKRQAPHDRPPCGEAAGDDT